MGLKKTVLRRRNEPEGELLHYRECGLDNVWLANGWRFEDTPLGRFLEIRDPDGLFAALARHIADRPGARTGGRELRYLRQFLDLTQAELGRLLGLSDQQVARWEKEQSRIEPAAFRLFCLLVRERLGDRVAVESQLRTAAAAASEIAAGRKRQARSVLAFRRSGWKIEVAA